jgi:hypothetical protein
MSYWYEIHDDDSVIAEFVQATATLPVHRAARLVPVVPERLAQWRVGQRPRINRITRRRLIDALARMKRGVPISYDSSA